MNKITFECDNCSKSTTVEYKNSRSIDYDLGEEYVRYSGPLYDLSPRDTTFCKKCDSKFAKFRDATIRKHRDETLKEIEEKFPIMKGKLE